MTGRLRWAVHGHLAKHVGSPMTLRMRESGGEGIRTPDPLNAIQVLSQLSYTPSIYITK